jgi:hypothetical protein
MTFFRIGYSPEYQPCPRATSEVAFPSHVDPTRANLDKQNQFKSATEILSFCLVWLTPFAASVELAVCHGAFEKGAPLG